LLAFTGERAIMLKLRAYRPGDFETLYAIDQACYEPAIAYSRRDLRSYIEAPGANCVVAESGGAIAGFILTEHVRALGYIVTIDVLAAHRRTGVGTLLLTEAERKLATDGVGEITLETATDTASTVAFWQKHGYRTRGIKKSYYPGGRDAFEMTKSIATHH
jgi:[ribosomal protein S18]-alanine N-acetyltransferase